MPKFKQLISPHSHSHYSLDGASTVLQIIKRNIELGATHVSLTEHGNMNSAMELYYLCKKLNVKPILGIEAYVETPFIDFYRDFYFKTVDEKNLEKKIQKVEKKLKNHYVHLTIHFKDLIAYRYFCELTPIMEERAVVKFGERKPVLKWDELQKISGHITLGSSCLVGAVQSMMYTKTGETHPEMAEKAYCMLRELAGPENFYVEIFPHKITHNWKSPKKDETGRIIKPGEFVPIGCNSIAADGDIQKVANQFVLEMARKYGDKPIISLDSHFAWPEQKLTQDARLGNGQESWKFHQSYHILSTDEVAEELKSTLNLNDKDIEEMVENSYEFASKFDNFKIETNEDRWVLPEIDSDWLKDLKAKIDRHGRMDWSNQQMVERLKKEVSVLTSNKKINLMSYFFIVEDIANFCRENNILMVVRGSSAGSLLLYLLGVSAVNPLKHGLSFERFLTLGRIKANTLPDVDMDISAESRERVVQYLQEKYGDGFCRISTDSLLKLKSSIKDAERALKGVVSPVTEKLCKSLPSEPQGVDSKDFVNGYTDSNGNFHQGLIEQNQELKKYIKDNTKIWQTVSEMLGIIRQKSGHACGIVIANEPIQKYCPIIKINDTPLTGFSPKSVELAGLVKYDLLGLNTLVDIQKCLESIKERTDTVLNPWDLPYDEKTFKTFQMGKTETVFQFDTETVRPFLISIKPKTIDDLAAITSLARPGTLDAPFGDGRTLADVYVARSNGEEITYINKDLEPILKNTMGINLYQEQTIEIFKTLAGYTAEEAETVRRAIGKKEEKTLAKATKRLKDSCIKRGWSPDEVDLLIEQIMASSRYSFNKSHAISYAYVAYACMYLKTNYPLDWWKSVLSNSDKEEMAYKFWPHVSDKISMPDINNSGKDYKIVGNKLMAPFSIINGVGEKAFQQLIENRPYSSLKEYIVKNHSKVEGKRSSVNSGTTRKLLITGVLDSILENSEIDIENKLYEFEKIKAEVRNESVKPVPEEFIGVTALGKFLMKKELISIYSEDLRPLIMRNRHGIKQGFCWYTQNGVQILSGQELEIAKKAQKDGKFYRNLTFAAIGYVIKERCFTYKNKTKQATELVIDFNGIFTKEVLWPPYNDEEGTEAPHGFQDKPVIAYFFVNSRKFQLDKVISFAGENEKEKYKIE
jgi:DNA polymerase-3 subunit alpha